MCSSLGGNLKFLVKLFFLRVEQESVLSWQQVLSGIFIMEVVCVDFFFMIFLFFYIIIYKCILYLKVFDNFV